MRPNLPNPPLTEPLQTPDSNPEPQSLKGTLEGTLLYVGPEPAKYEQFEPLRPFWVVVVLSSVSYTLNPSRFGGYRSGCTSESP